MSVAIFQGNELLCEIVSGDGLVFRWLTKICAKRSMNFIFSDRKSL